MPNGPRPNVNENENENENEVDEQSWIFLLRMSDAPYSSQISMLMTMQMGSYRAESNRMKQRVPCR